MPAPDPVAQAPTSRIPDPTAEAAPPARPGPPPARQTEDAPTTRFAGLAGARKGSGNFHIVVRGRAAHAGRDFDKGRNAVVAAMAIGQALAKPKRPLVAIVAGSKVSTKLTILKALSEKVDGLIVGGGFGGLYAARALASFTLGVDGVKLAYKNVPVGAAVAAAPPTPARYGSKIMSTIFWMVQASNW